MTAETVVHFLSTFSLLGVDNCKPLTYFHHKLLKLIKCHNNLSR